MTRSYRLGRRGEAADQTRRRIVDATYALHAERGIAATSMKQIAARADVSVGTVYHHFPTYDDAIRACGQHALALAPPIGLELFAGAATRAERVRRLVRAVFARYQRLPNVDAVRHERGRFAPLQKVFAEEEAQARALAVAALRASKTDIAAPDAADVATLVALVENSVCRTLLDAGLSVEAAAQRIAAVINAWLDARETARA